MPVQKGKLHQGDEEKILYGYGRTVRLRFYRFPETMVSFITYNFI